MSILEPPPEGIDPVDVESEADTIVIPKTPAGIQAFRDTCAECKRPLVDFGDGMLRHENANIDSPANPAFHFPIKYVEPPIAWGFLNSNNRRTYGVESGLDEPSKSYHPGGSL